MLSVQKNNENRSLKTNRLFPTPNKPDPMPQNLAFLFTKITPDPVLPWHFFDMLVRLVIGIHVIVPIMTTCLLAFHFSTFRSSTFHFHFHVQEQMIYMWNVLTAASLMFDSPLFFQSSCRLFHIGGCHRCLHLSFFCKDEEEAIFTCQVLMVIAYCGALATFPDYWWTCTLCFGLPFSYIAIQQSLSSIGSESLSAVNAQFM